MSRLSEYLFREKRLKILSLALAILLWLAVNYGTEKEISVQAKIRVLRVKEGFEVKSFDNESVFLRLRGSPLRLRKIKKIELLLDLSQAKEGILDYEIKRKDFILPEGISIEEIEPKYIKIRVERKENG